MCKLFVLLLEFSFRSECRQSLVSLSFQLISLEKSISAYFDLQRNILSLPLSSSTNRLLLPDLCLKPQTLRVWRINRALSVEIEMFSRKTDSQLQDECFLKRFFRRRETQSTEERLFHVEVKVSFNFHKKNFSEIFIAPSNFTHHERAKNSLLSLLCLKLISHGTLASCTGWGQLCSLSAFQINYKD